jgi:hypothetical protein
LLCAAGDRPKCNQSVGATFADADGRWRRAGDR